MIFFSDIELNDVFLVEIELMGWMAKGFPNNADTNNPTRMETTNGKGFKKRRIKWIQETILDMWQDGYNDMTYIIDLTDKTKSKSYQESLCIRNVQQESAK